MSQTLAPKNVDNRRDFLTLAVAAAAIVPIWSEDVSSVPPVEIRRPVRSGTSIIW